MDEETLTIKRLFQVNHINLSDVWLQSCISWCKQENLQANYTPNELKGMVYQQWLVLDLRDAEVACLPPNLAAHKKYVLNGTYSLQIMQLVDISKPKHGQLQKIRNTNNSLAKTFDQEQECAKRMLQLTLTDGIQEIEAMEYKPIANLNVNLKPGIKIRLTGPVTIRRGRIMLEEQHVKVLGGEVEEILVVNAAENVLARALKLEENPNPQSIVEDVDVKENDAGNSTVNTVQNLALNARKNATSFADNRTNYAADEELRIAAEIDMLMEAERDMEQSVKTSTEKNRAPAQTPDIFDDDLNDSDFDNIDVIETTTENLITTEKTMVEAAKDVDLLSESLDVFDDIDIDGHLNKFDDVLQETAINLTDIKDLLNKTTAGVFKVKAKFKSIVEKLNFSADEFHLIIKIEDDGGEMAARVHSDIISGFAGYTPAGIMSLKSDVKQKDSNATSKVIQAIQSIKEHLILLDNVVEIQIDNNLKTPTIVKIFEK